LKAHLRLGYLSATSIYPKRYMLTRLSRCWSGFDLKVILHCQILIPKQRRNGVWWRPEQETSLAPLCSNLRSFGRKCTVLKNVLVTLLGLFGGSRSDLTPGELCPLSPFVTPPFPRAEFSKSKSDLTFVAMSATSIGERQFCLFNQAHKSIKNILFSGMSWQRGEWIFFGGHAVFLNHLMKRHNCATYQSTPQSGGKGTHKRL